MTSLAALTWAASESALEVLGGFHPTSQDRVPNGTKTLLLLGPAEPGFWDHVTASPEFRDGLPDPLNRWSTRVVDALAADFGAVALYPFGGPPYQPFITWAKRTGRVWTSPVTLLVHDSQGLMVSFRAALAMPERLELPKPTPCPCDTCEDQPCRGACPVNALSGNGYDATACHDFLDTSPGANCMANGCRVRRACPISQSYGRLEAQSAFHMTYFHR